jgi:site-specific DNA-methyltransferase (adenine-specific)/adenine-specific DNA-methyltransferase
MVNPMTNLTDRQRQEIMGYLESGQEVPEDYKHLLFPPERREYELVYAGKEREEDIIANTWGVPLQAVKTFSLARNASHPEWTNRLIFGDNLQVMKRLLSDEQVKGKVKLVYIDPPFATKQDFQGNQDQKAYQDKVGGAEFVEFIRRRLVMIRELLASDGSLYLHLDQKKCHYLKVVADEVFGEANFRNEVIWRNTNAHNKAETYGQIHQTILFYTRSSRVAFWKQYRPRYRRYVEAHYRHSDDKGRHRLSDLTGSGIRTGESGRTWLGYNPTRAGRHWAIPGYVYDLIDDDISNLSPLEKLDYLHDHGFIEPPDQAGGQPQIKRWEFIGGGNAVQDLWTYQPYTQGIYEGTDDCIDQDVTWAIGPGERTGYPTQKPEGLIQRIIKSSTEQGDLVLDAFAGAGTTLAVAEKLGRRWIGIDCGKLAVYTMQKRLMNLRKEIGQKGEPLVARPFTLFNAGLYDFKRMSELPWEDYRLFAMQLFQVRDKRHTLSGIQLDGFKNDADVLVFSFKTNGDVVVDEEYVQDLHGHIGSRTRDEFYIIAPASRVTFLEDYIDHGRTRYYVLRIPYSIIDELHDRPFEQIRQPVDEADINNTVEAVGFDFIIPPTVSAKYAVGKREGELFDAPTVTIEEFRSEAMTKRPRRFENRETLSMVMVDYDYTGNGEGVFDLDAVFYRHDMEQDAWKVRLDASQFGEKIMIIYVDIFGNELREVKRPEDFGIKRDRVAKASPTCDGERGMKRPIRHTGTTRGGDAPKGIQRDAGNSRQRSPRKRK